MAELLNFPESNVVFGEGQPEVLPLPAHRDANGVVTCAWKLTEDELEQVLVTGIVWHQTHTGNRPLQPQLILAHKPGFLA